MIRWFNNFTKIRKQKLNKEKSNYDIEQINKEIKSALDELNCIRMYYDLVDAPELIEYAIYQEKAITARLSYLYKLAKKYY